MLTADRAFMRGMLAAGTRYDGRGLTDVRRATVSRDATLFPTAVEGLRLELPDSGAAVLVGLSAEVLALAEERAPAAAELVRLELKSTAAGQREPPAELAELTGLVERFLLERLPAERLRLAPRAHWRLFLDVLVVGALTLADLDWLFAALRLALLSARLPRVRVSFNAWREEFVYETMEESAAPFLAADLPVVRLVGELEGRLVLDLHADELRAVDAWFVVAVGAEGALRAVEKLDGRPRDPQRVAVVLARLEELGRALAQEAA